MLKSNVSLVQQQIGRTACQQVYDELKRHYFDVISGSTALSLRRSLGVTIITDVCLALNTQLGDVID